MATAQAQLPADGRITMKLVEVLFFTQLNFTVILTSILKFETQ
jgi:hypothetical protein